MSTTTVSPVTSPSEPALVVFGRDGTGKPRASWFDAGAAERASKAAELMKLRALRIETDEQKALARQLARGRFLATGRAFTPVARAAVFDKLLNLVERGRAAAHQPDAAANVGEPERAANGAASAHPEPLRLASQAAGPGPGYSASAATSDRPKDWDEIGLGSLVLAFDPSYYAWFEALVIAENGDLLTLRWRDYPHEGTVQRRATQLALLPPEKP